MNARDPLGSLGSVRIIKDPSMVETRLEPVEQVRTWRQRLFTRPWRPLQRTETVRRAVTVPSPTLLRATGFLGPCIIGHPETVAKVILDMEGRRWES